MKPDTIPTYNLYLNLLKKTISFLLWPEPSVPIDVFSYQKNPVKRFLIKLTSNALRKFNLQLCTLPDIDEDKRINGLFWPLYAETMIGIKRLNNIQYCIEEVLKNKIEGDLIETGVWRGGACIFMQAVLSANSCTTRKIFVADSFEGLPKPDEKTYPKDMGDRHYTQQFLAIPVEQVQQNFEKYGLLAENVVFLKGWFKDTLPHAPINKLSLMRLDGDMYESTMDALMNLYDKLSVGGFCIIDDYALHNCKAAVEDFRKEHKITEPIEPIDQSSVYWRKMK